MKVSAALASVALLASFQQNDALITSQELDLEFLGEQGLEKTFTAPIAYLETRNMVNGTYGGKFAAVPIQQIEQFCSATLIARNVALTTATCAKQLFPEEAREKLFQEATTNGGKAVDLGITYETFVNHLKFNTAP